MKGKETAQVSEKLKGPAGTEVKVTVDRPGADKELEITIQRRVIQINPVPYYGMLDAKTGVIILNNFTQNCAGEVEKAFNDLKQDRKSTRLNSSHVRISYAVFCLKKKKKKKTQHK